MLKLFLTLAAAALARPRAARCRCCPEHRPTERPDVRGPVPR